jgi:phage-related protein
MARSQSVLGFQRSNRGIVRRTAKCRRYLLRLAQFGNELRRPVADYLRDGIYELRIRHTRVNYRILYGFVGQDVVLISHGITKERLVPANEIELAVQRLA